MFPPLILRGAWNQSFELKLPNIYEHCNGILLFKLLAQQTALAKMNKNNGGGGSFLMTGLLGFLGLWLACQR